MNLKYTIPLAGHSLQELVSIWYQLWELPFFRSCKTEVRTSDPDTYGSYILPTGTPMPVFEGIIRGVEPVSFCVDTPDFYALLNLSRRILCIDGSGTLCQQVGQMLERMAPTLTPKPYTPLTLAYDHPYLRGYRLKPNPGAVMLMRMQSISWLNKRLQWAHIKMGNALQTGQLPDNARPYLLMVSDESDQNVIVCSVTNDRLVGFGNVPDLLQNNQ